MRGGWRGKKEAHPRSRTQARRSGWGALVFDVLVGHGFGQTFDLWAGFLWGFSVLQRGADGDAVEFRDGGLVQVFAWALLHSNWIDIHVGSGVVLIRNLVLVYF